MAVIICEPVDNVSPHRVECKEQRATHLLDKVVRLLAIGKDDLGSVAEVSVLWPLQHLTAAEGEGR